MICEFSRIPAVLNAEVHPDDVKDVYQAFEYINYKCQYGYSRDGYAHIQCDANGNWTDPVIECRRKL